MRCLLCAVYVDGERLSSASHDTEKIVVTVNKAGGPLGLALAGGSDTDVGDIRVSYSHGSCSLKLIRSQKS